MPFSTNVMGVDNLIENGTFDTSMDSWNIQTSENFTITSDAGVCNVNTTHTDWLFDQDESMLNATTHNMTVLSGDPAGVGLTHYTSMNYTQYEVMNSTFDNYSMDGWEYSEPEDEHLALFLRQNYSEAYNLSEKVSLGVESIKLHNVTDFSTNFSTEPTSMSYGNASTDIVWRNNQLECNLTTNRDATRMWNITELSIGANDKFFGMTADIISNESGLQEIWSFISIGFDNIKNLNKTYTIKNTIKLTLMRYNTTHMSSRFHTFNATSSGHATDINNINSQFNYSNFTNGITIEIYRVGGVLYANIKDLTSGYVLAKHLLAIANPEFTLNTIAVEDFIIGSKTMSANITSMETWIAPNNLPSTAVATLENTRNIVNDSVVLGINTNRLHYHDAQGGIVRSSVTINTNNGTEELSNQSTTSISSWYNTDDRVKDVTGNVTLSTWNYFSMVEGATTFPAKAVYYDNLTLTATEFSHNSTYTSQVFDREYYAEWRDIVVYFNPLDETYTGIPVSMDTIFNLTIYTRVGDHSTIDGTWSSWEETTGVAYHDEGGVLVWEGLIASKNGRYVQYSMEIELWKRGLESPIFLLGELSSLPINTSMEWGSFDQDIVKPYTNYTTLKYDYKIQDLNNTINGTIGVYIDGTLINQHNYTTVETAWQYVEIALNETYNASGTYNLNFTVISNFNSTNGTSTILFDNVELLIEEQAPTITSFNIYNTTSKAIFNGTFKDLTIGSDYEYLGMGGIDSVNITIGKTVLDIIDYQYIGNGSFEFNYTWSNIPFDMEEIEMNATLTVKDTSDLEGTDISSITFPNTSTVLTFLIAQVFIIIIVFVLIRYFYLIWCDSDHDGKKDKECKI